MTKLRGTLCIIDNLSKWSGQVVAPLALVYMTIILIEIVSRYFFNAPTKWAHEISTFIFGAQFMLAGAYAMWRGSFVNVDILHDRLPIRARAIIDAVLFLLPLFICIVIIWKGWGLFWYALKLNEHSNSTWGPPLYPLRGVIPVAAFLLLLQAVGKLIRDLYLAISGEQLR